MFIWKRRTNEKNETVNKVALSPDDDKRVVLEAGISTLAIGPWRFKKPKMFSIF